MRGWAVVFAITMASGCDGQQHGSVPASTSDAGATSDASSPASAPMEPDLGSGGGEGGSSGDGGSAEELTPLPSGPTRYLDGSEGWVAIEATEQRFGSNLIGSWFWAAAQFYEPSSEAIDFGTILDPPEGIDDCSVSQSSGLGAGGAHAFRIVGEATLVDGDVRIPFAKDFSPWSNYIDLTALDVEPRYGGIYGFEAHGGDLPTDVSIDEIVLPARLAIAELEHARRLERSDQSFTWTGGSEGVLDLTINIYRHPFGSGEGAYFIRCVVNDDGAFTLPAEVLDLVPQDGIARLYWTRESRALADADGHAILTIGQVKLEQELAFGDECDGTAAASACEAYAEASALEYERCGQTAEAPSKALLCPDYLAESCAACPELYECLRENTKCDGTSVVGSGECTCP